MKTRKSWPGLVSATLVASAGGWLAQVALWARHAAARSAAADAFAWTHAAFAALAVPLWFAAVAALWLGLGLTLEARWLGDAVRPRRERWWRGFAVSLLFFGLPGYALMWTLTSGTSAWKPGLSWWLYALIVTTASPVLRLTLIVLFRALQKLRGGREVWLGLGLALAALIAFGVWAQITAPFRERYGASQLLSYGLVTSGLLLVAWAWFAPRSGTGRAPLRWLLGLLVASTLALFTTPSRAALELFYLERPTRWFGRVLTSLAPDSDGDGIARNFGFLRGGDCDDTDPRRHPLAFDVPGNGVDENCFAGDATAAWNALSPIARIAEQRAVPQAAARNVIVIALDSFRFDRRFANGLDPAVTPTLARLAASSVAFSNFRTCAPRTRESVSDLLGARAGQADDPERPNGVKALAERGVHTAFIASSWLTRHVAITGFVEQHHPPARYGEFADDRVAALLATFAASAPPEPFFLFAHFLGAHEPYDTGKACRRDTTSPYARYLCALSELDRKLAGFLEVLNVRGLRKRTVLAVTADHGEEFSEHGGRYHATTLYDEVLRVPLLLEIPGRDGALVATPLSCLDFLPTVLGAANFPADIALRGRDRLDPANGGEVAQFARTRLVEELPLFEPRTNAVVDGGFKLLWDRTTGLAVYFNLETDPGELSPLASAPAPVQARLLSLMDGWLSDQVSRPAPGELRVSSISAR